VALYREKRAAFLDRGEPVAITVVRGGRRVNLIFGPEDLKKLTREPASSAPFACMPGGGASP